MNSLRDMFYYTMKKFIMPFFICYSFFGFSQDIPIGDWRDHLPYSDAVSVTYGNNIVYCAANSGIFMYDKTDMTIEKLNLVNGLSDIGVNKIQFNSYNNSLIIAYTNGNIDVIKEDKSIINLSFIKNSNIIGSKTINHIYLKGKLAYLSTGFGIVVLDTDKPEITETYLFGPIGSYMFTNAVTIDGNTIYAATDQGIYFADINSPNLIDYNEWSLLTDLGTQSYSNIISFSGRLFTSSKSSVWEGDTIYYNDLGLWQKFIPNGLNVKTINISNGKLLITTSNILIYNASLTQIEDLYTINGWYIANAEEALIDNDGIIWYADNNHGLIKTINNWDNEIIVPDGPTNSNAFAMDFVNNELWTVSGGYGIYLSKNLINHFSDNTWGNLGSYLVDADGNTTFDLVSIAINPNNISNVYAGSWSSGLYEFNNGVVTNIYNAQNSPLDSTFFGSTAIGAIKFDKDNNLWISSSYTDNILAVKTPNNNWYNYSFPGTTKIPGTSSTENYHQMIIDKNNYKWIISSEENRVLVFDDNGTLDNNNDDRKAYNDNIPGTEIQCIVEDLNGEIWVGTNEGIGVFYNPSTVFDEDIQAEQIFIQQDGQTQILLETETVTAIAVDGANRKWIGTQNSGVFLISEDGTEEIEHFTTENSPLFSNNIFDIVINDKTGEVFFGTEKGLLSYKGTATEAKDDFSNIFVYPNPVKPDFNGTIAIRGLVKDTDVRITDISGNIVYQTTSLGGQAIWDGKDFNGNKVQTGVYMVFNGGPDGNQKAAAKILFIH